MSARPSKHSIIVGLLGALIWMGGTVESHGRGPNLESLPAAKQTGGSCGFFANVPALTLATGINIRPSQHFIRSIYGLRRGDFMYQRSFDKKMFYELFSINYSETKIEHPPGSADEMIPVVRRIIRERFHNGLANGQVYSLRIRGIANGPHNGLLLGRKGDNYLLHDPYPGIIKTVSQEQLASLMLVRSTTGKNLGKSVHVTHFLTASLPTRVTSGFISVTSLPRELDVSLSVEQRGEISKLLKKAPSSVMDSEISTLVESYPGVDFAVLPAKGEKRGWRNVIGSELEAKDLGGMINLSKLTLNVWNQKRRSLLPVVMMDGEPWVFIRYLAADSENPDRATLVFDNGRDIRWLSRQQALEKMRKAGALYGTIGLKRE